MVPSEYMTKLLIWRHLLIMSNPLVVQQVEEVAEVDIVLRRLFQSLGKRGLRSSFNPRTLELV